MLGYINNPEVTAETIDEDEWIHTGDVGVVDKDGNLFIVDRIKFMACQLMAAGYSFREVIKVSQLFYRFINVAHTVFTV